MEPGKFRALLEAEMGFVCIYQNVLIINWWCGNVDVSLKT
jgi:hypothetical protein